MTRGLARVAAVVGLVCAVAVVGAVGDTDAAWTDSERASDSFAAGVVNPVTQMACTAGLLAPVRFTFAAPTGGLARTGYRWTVTGGFTASGTAPANATYVELTSGLLGVGTGTFSLYVVGPGGWESRAKTGQLGFTTGLISSCSVN
ncbi:hypothetical protein JOD63_003150 [Microbacterium terrae]|uniref:Uncharacterized protein n=1 Tax=Microbacterium terrae TaxID=69369 RepID=A0A0M2H2K8_9MICO|nr:hypothetical protein [Microbacterium terrae]KJL40493.1 hypothetical protein RS81_01577 [Microbacterium terrae]MBP1079182.1 hypothetical protein [Microbacterium terrae]GLJ98583.1 hypothetical protein GCM10017594_17800 [Microbacterium terrae]